MLPNMCVGVTHALVTLEGRPVCVGYMEVDLPQRELSNDICNDTVHTIPKNGFGYARHSTFLLIGGVQSESTTLWSSL